MDRVLIVGAGMAGLLAGNFLQENGVDVTVVDKGRGVGGRMATRRLGSGRADHGAQFFTVRSEVFGRWVAEWEAAGAAVEWSRGFGPQRDDGHPRYRGVEGMTSIPKHLARPLDVRLGTEVVGIGRQGGGWLAEAAGGARFTAGGLLLTAPVPQSLALLAAGGVELPPAERQGLNEIRYDPCFAVLAVVDGDSDVPAPGGVQIRGEPIAWIADNRMKGISPGETAVTIHAGPVFSRERFEDDPHEVGEALLAAAAEQGWLDRGRVREVQVQRWRYAQPVSHYPRRFLLLMHEASGGRAPLAFAGDAFGESRVEGAALSGLSAAEALLIANS